MILQDANIINKDGNVYTKGCSKKSIGKRINPFKFNNWQEVTKEQIDIAMLMPGEYKEKDGKFYIKRGMLDGYICDEFYQEEVKTIPITNTIDLFPEDQDMDNEETKFEHKVVESVDHNKIRKAKKIMRKAFDSDEQFKWGYILNVAMHLYAELCEDGLKLEVNRRNEIAEKILQVVFYLGEEE